MCYNYNENLIRINPYECIEGHAALDRNPEPGYNTLLLRLIPGYLLRAYPHRKFLTYYRPFRQMDCTIKRLP